ncbi:MAG: hypothetical protein RL095_3110 [Verrucomicrobiota bacterium]|jgi:HPt (histidine-containing phosphotransfer) domain-containing protein
MTPPDLSVRLAAVPGLGYREGLQRVGGNPDFYAKVLRLFCDKIESTAKRLEELHRDGGRRIEFGREVHSLKGTSGNLAIRPVHDAACVLDHALKTRQSETEVASSLRHLVDHCRAFQIDLSLALGEASCSRPSPQLPSPKLLLQLKVWIDNCDCAALQLIDDEAAALEAILGSAGHGQLRQALHRFDWRQAAAELDKLAP